MPAAPCSAMTLERVGETNWGKTPVIGVRDCATGYVVAIPITAVNQETAMGFLGRRVEEQAKTYTDDSPIYNPVENHSSVNHSHGNYVRGEVHTNSIESFWALLNRAYQGVYHWWSAKQCHRYVDECAGRYNLRFYGTLGRLSSVFYGMQGKRLTYAELTS